MRKNEKIFRGNYCWFVVRCFCDADFSLGNGRKVGEMRSKYLRKLLDLITEMEGERYELRSEEKALLWTMSAIFAAFWFYQMDDLWQHISVWKIHVSDSVTADALLLADNFLEAEAAEIATAEAEASKMTEEEATADVEGIIRVPRLSPDERIDRLLKK